LKKNRIFQLISAIEFFDLINWKNSIGEINWNYLARQGDLNWKIVLIFLSKKRRQLRRLSIISTHVGIYLWAMTP